MLTRAEKKRLENYKQLGTMNQVQFLDYHELLNREFWVYKGEVVYRDSDGKVVVKEVTPVKKVVVAEDVVVEEVEYPKKKHWGK